MCVSSGAHYPRCPRHSLQYVQAFNYRLHKEEEEEECASCLVFCYSPPPSPHPPLANQPGSKVCVHGYLFPLPVALGPVPHPSYDATAGTEPVTQRRQTAETKKNMDSAEN